MTTAALIKENFSLGLALVCDLVCDHCGGKHGSMQADIVLEKELRVLCLDHGQQKRLCATLGIA